MSTDLADLHPQFRAAVESVLAVLRTEGLFFRPYFTRRDPVTQARLWRQSRSAAVVRAQVEQLRRQGCDFMVACFDRAGPADGPWATNALPGQSWHQFGEAVDCYRVDATGSADWERRQYARYGQIANAHGLFWGGHFGDANHLQWRRVEPPEVFGGLRQIDTALAAAWTHLLAAEAA